MPVTHPLKTNPVKVFWCCALFPVAALAQPVDSSQAYLRECTAMALAAQASTEEKMKALAATEGINSPKVIKIKNALEGWIERATKKCEEGAQLEAKNTQLEAKNTQLEAKNTQLEAKNTQLEAKGAQIRQETAQLEAKGAQIRQETAQIRQETAQITSIKSRFDKMGDDLPKIDELLAGLISQRWSAQRTKEAIHQIDAFVSNAQETLDLTRGIPAFQTPEYRRLFASIEQNIQRIHSVLHGKKTPGSK